MKLTGKVTLMISAFTVAVVPLLSQTSLNPRPSFEVVSIRPNTPAPGGMRIAGGGARGNRYTMTGATLRMLLQNAYQRPSTGGPSAQVQVINGPSWIDSDRYDIQATVDCSGGPVPREQVPLMVQSMLEDRFQLKIHMETRELPIYNLAVAKDGPKIKASPDQTPPSLPTGGSPQPCSPVSSAPLIPPPAPGQRGGPLDLNFTPPRGALMMMMMPTGLTMQASGVPITTLVNMLQQQVGRPVIDKTGLEGLFDFRLQFSPEGLTLPGLPGGFPPQATPFGPAGAPPAGTATTPSAAADPVPSLFTAIQELGLRLESARGPVEVLVIDSVQKPTEN